MPVYVDPVRRYGRPVHGRSQWCHMVADTHRELKIMIRAMGANPAWIQKPGTPHEHVDLTPGMRALAIRHGAVEVNLREMGEILAGKRLTRTGRSASIEV